MTLGVRGRGSNPGSMSTRAWGTSHRRQQDETSIAQVDKSAEERPLPTQCNECLDPFIDTGRSSRVESSRLEEAELEGSKVTRHLDHHSTPILSRPQHQNIPNKGQTNPPTFRGQMEVCTSTHPHGQAEVSVMHRAIAWPSMRT